MNTMLEIECKNECTDLGVSGVTRDELLHEALVRGLREPALLVDQRHDAHRLREKEKRRVRSLKRHFFPLKRSIPRGDGVVWSFMQ